ncbi:hypothetical protein PAECIP111802_04180 [Paenibacillus allorhizosphaerae]|uniref:Methyltransferase n=2 Tax=Paenibacillus allorhizosphaerae TaxID=2849866 RepID=A0ABM8VL96_9BACL|nr:hypothetical protein PAECIP111802_04180 [Paenibacillus allorhizosphaerae]
MQSDGSVTFKGRSWFLPMLLMATGVFCLISFRGLAGQGNLYWITGASYIFLAVLIYWVRRPFIKIGKNALTSRRFGGDRTVEASQINEITIGKDAVVVQIKPKGNRWVFTRVYNRFQMDELNGKMKEFAAKNNVTLKEE